MSTLPSSRADVAASARPDDRCAFGDFVRPHWDAMTRLARRYAGIEWEDVLQDALVLAWRKRDRFDATRGTALTWLLTLTTDAARKRRRRQTPTLELVDSAVEPAHRDVDLDRAVAHLSGRRRSVIELHYFLGLPVADVAAILGCAEGTVKSTLSDARKQLRDELGSDYR